MLADPQVVKHTTVQITDGTVNKISVFSLSPIGYVSLTIIVEQIKLK